jgi:hypothetical protein
MLQNSAITRLKTLTCVKKGDLEPAKLSHTPRLIRYKQKLKLKVNGYKNSYSFDFRRLRVS